MSDEKIKSGMPPPLPCLLGVIAGLACDWLRPWRIAPYDYALPVGLVLVGVVVALSVALALVFKRHNTPVDPQKETTAIIDTGPFRFSRNPAYVSVATLQTAIGFLINSTWIVLFVVPAVLAIQQIVILREEAYLEKKFGEAYLNYKSRVRRWV